MKKDLIRDLKLLFTFMVMQENLKIEFINLNHFKDINVNFLIISWRGFSGNFR